MGFVYIARNKSNDKPYIGQTTLSVDKRFYYHTKAARKMGKRKSHFHGAINKYGTGNFHITSIEMPDTALDVMEKLLIGNFDSLKNGYNLTEGGNAPPKGRKKSSFKKGHAAWHKGKKCPQISAALKGKKLTEGHRRNISKGQIGRIPWNKGVKCPQISKGKMKKIILIHPDGTEEYFGSMSDACGKYDLCPGHLSSVAGGKRPHHKGFKCKYYKETDK